MTYAYLAYAEVTYAYLACDARYAGLLGSIFRMFSGPEWKKMFWSDSPDRMVLPSPAMHGRFAICGR